MVSQEIHHTTRLACEIGKPFGMSCRYEWDSVKRTFAWKFFRNGQYVGKTTNAKDVIPRMQRYTEHKGSTK